MKPQSLFSDKDAIATNEGEGWNSLPDILWNEKWAFDPLMKFFTLTRMYTYTLFYYTLDLFVGI